MVVGSGLIAKAFIRVGANAFVGNCFYAAGVSNSGCNDEREFRRERERFDAVMAGCHASDRIVYFSTCSIEDPSAQDSEYVKHKIQMENRVRSRARYLILRLPQVAGKTPNPHTLLNYLHARIVRSERFNIWSGATRNIIDVDDVVKITLDLITREGANAETVNIASTRSIRMLDIVHAMERVLGTRAVFDILDKGSMVPIDTGRILSSIRRCGLIFGDAYIGGIIEKYYGTYCFGMEAALPVSPSVWQSSMRIPGSYSNEITGKHLRVDKGIHFGHPPQNTVLSLTR
jgi:hypothetical protein